MEKINEMDGLTLEKKNNKCYYNKWLMVLYA